ncbi:hypothetical protein Tco_0986302 [Tanacetum coccineum]
MDDDPMCAADRVVAPTPGSAITIPKTANEFSIKGNHLTLVKGNQFDGRTKTDPHKHIHGFLGICDMFKYRDTKNEAIRLMMFPLSLIGEAKTWLDELNEGTIEMKCSKTAMVIICPKAILSKYFTMVKLINFSKIKSYLSSTGLKIKKPSHFLRTISFADEGSSNSDTDKIMARMDSMTMKMDAQYKELQSRAKKPMPDLDEDDMPMSRKEEAKFMQTFSYQPLQSRNEHVNVVFTRSGKSYDPSVNPNDQQNNSEAPINFDSDAEDDEPTPQPKTKNPKLVKETPLTKPYKLEILYP